jgi:hypothetical protein
MEKKARATLETYEWALRTRDAEVGIPASMNSIRAKIEFSAWDCCKRRQPDWCPNCILRARAYKIQQRRRHQKFGANEVLLPRAETR